LTSRLGIQRLPQHYERAHDAAHQAGKQPSPAESGTRPILAKDWMNRAERAANDDVAGEGKVRTGACRDAVHGRQYRNRQRADRPDQRVIVTIEMIAEIGDWTVLGRVS